MDRVELIKAYWPIDEPLQMERVMGTTGKKKKNRSKLGRGLSALVDSAGPAIQVAPELSSKQIANILQQANDQVNDQAQNQANAQAGDQVDALGNESADGLDDGRRVVEIDVQSIVPNQHQPRRVFEEEALEELAASIAAHGLMQPIVVRVCELDEGGLGDDEKYELIAGERRWRATCRTGADRIRAIVIEADDLKSAQLALIENIQREDLNPMERASGFSMLSERFGMTQEQISTQVGVSRSAVANFIRLMELGDEIRGMIASGQLGGGHGKALLSLPDDGSRLIMARLAANEGWTVRILEQRVIAHNKHMEMHNSGPEGVDGADQRGLAGSGGGDSVSRLESVLQDLEKRLGEQLSTRVKLKTDKSGTKGSILIEFYDLDHFEGLMGRLGIDSSDEVGMGS